MIGSGLVVVAGVRAIFPGETRVLPASSTAARMRCFSSAAILALRASTSASFSRDLASALSLSIDAISFTCSLVYVTALSSDESSASSCLSSGTDSSGSSSRDTTGSSRSPSVTEYSFFASIMMHGPWLSASATH